MIGRMVSNQLLCHIAARRQRRPAVKVEAIQYRSTAILVRFDDWTEPNF